MGILTLPIASGMSKLWKPLSTDLFVHLLLVIMASYFLEWRIRKYPTKVLASLYATILALLSAVALFLLADMFLSSFLISNENYLDQIQDSRIIRFILAWLCLGWVAHITVLRKHQDENQKDTALHQHAVASLREAELFKLRQQLQPHFLYNSLNSINALIQLDPENAQEMVGKLSDFLRLSVKRDTKEMISVKDELDYIETYLAIESIRFGNRLQIQINKEGEEWQSAYIPAFILQPILENAIKFGLYGNTGTVTIKIDISLQENVLNINIQNPFDAATQSLPGTGFGLEGISRRLTILYGRADLLDVKKQQNIFSTTVKIPQ